MKARLPKIKLPDFSRSAGLEGLTEDEKSILMSFHSRGSKTMGQIFSGSIKGARTVDIIDKLRDFGFIKRDWKKEIEIGVDVVYTITEFGAETAKKYESVSEPDGN